MTTASKKFTSICLSTVMLLGNMFSPITAFAQEAVTEADYVQTEDLPETEETAPDKAVTEPDPETEARNYIVTLPYYGELTYSVDESHVQERKPEGDTKLTYKAGEDVKVTVNEAEGFKIDTLKLIDENKKEHEYTWEALDRIAFAMPETNLWLDASFTVLSGGEPGDSGAGDPANVDPNRGMADPAQPASQEEITPASAPVDDAAGQTVMNEDASGTVSVDQPGSGMGIPAIEPEMDADGFPAEGSVVQLAEILIGYDDTELVVEGTFPDVTYPQESCTNTYISNSIQYGVPGLYDAIYRVNESNTGKFWYVVRPVRVSEPQAAPQKDGGDEASDADSDEAEPAEDSDTDTEEDDGETAAETDDPTPADIPEEALSETDEGSISEDEETQPDDSLDVSDMNGKAGSDEAASADGQDVTSEGDEPEDVSLHNIFFAVDGDYQISLDNGQLTYQEGEPVAFTVKAKENYAIKTASALLAFSPEEVSDGDIDENDDERVDASPVLITDEAISLARTDAVTENGLLVEAAYTFDMPSEDVVLSASVMNAAASNDVEVKLENGGIKNIPKAWTPDGKTWANGSTVIGYTKYRTVTMPDGKERKAYCLQPALGAEDDGKYTATEIRKKGKISAAEATLLRKAVFYCYGGPGWGYGGIKDILSDCSSNDEYYVATHYILAKIYCDATSGNWNVATSAGTDYVAVNAKGKAAIEKAVTAIGKLADPSASLSTSQVSAVYNEATGFAESQTVTYSSTVSGNDLTVTLPAGVYLSIVGGTTYEPGQKAVISPGSTFFFKKSGYEGSHTDTFNLKAAVFTDFDAYLINVASDKQNMGFSYVADKDFELSVSWPDLMTRLNIEKHDALTGTTTPTANYTMDGAVYGIYADEGRTQLLEQLTINGGTATSSESFLIGHTYYIAEISAPAEYQIDPNVYPVVAVAGGTATVISNDTPKMLRISVQKYDKETGNPYPITTALSFEGAVFGIYADAACTVKATDYTGAQLPDIRSDANGLAQTDQNLPISTYYVKELAAPEGYLVNDEVFTISADQARDEIVNQDANAELACKEQIIRANVDLMKVKTLKGLYTQAAEGVEFYFTYVKDPSIRFSVLSGRENTVVTDKEGYATTAHKNYPLGTLIYGEWQITEGNTPEGFEALDPTTMIITGNGRTYRFVANNRQIHAAVLIEKHDDNTGSLIPAQGVKFTLYKDGQIVRLFNATTRVYEDTWITDADGMVQLPEMLDYGTYTVKEDPDSLPDDYFVMGDASFTVDEMADDYLHPVTFTAMEPPQMGNIMVEKKDAKTGESLEGFSFEIVAAEDITDLAGVIRTGPNADGESVPLTAGTIVQRLITGQNGNAVSKDLFLGRYSVRETEVKNGYAIETQTKDVTIKGDHTKAKRGENVSEYVLFSNHPTMVKITKTDAKTGAKLAGVTFLVHKLAEGEKASDYAFTGEEETSDGEIAAPVKENVREASDEDAEDSDEDDDEIDDETDDEDDTDDDSEDDDSDDEDAGEDDEEDADDTSDAGEEKEDKSDRQTDVNDDWDETIPEQESGLDESLINEDELFVTDENGEILIEYLDADSTYVISEVKTIPGYNLSRELASFSVDANGLIEGNYLKEISMVNEPNRLKVSKQDITNGEEVPGAHLTITGSDGKVVAEWTSTYEPHEIDALPAGIYTLTEVTAPDGYEEEELITFKVINSRKIQTVAMKDSPFREVEISKTDITGDKEIPGAHLTITDDNGNEVESWISDADVHTIKLHSGRYTLTETKPADGYVTAESIAFTVIKTSEKDYDVQGVAMKDDVTKVQISKSDITDSKPVIGAELIISDEEGNELYRWITTEELYYIEMLPIGTYTLTEVTAPDGYATAETATFTVEDTGEIQKVDMADAPISVMISKKDIADGEGGKELPGAHLIVKNEKGETIDEWTSTDSPHLITLLPVGKYTLTEITAPYGYELAETITFEITDTGITHKVTMYDAPKEETVDLTGKKKTTRSGPGYTPGPGTSVVTPPVKTGDDTPIILWVLAAVIGAGIGMGTAFYRKKRTRREM